MDIIDRRLQEFDSVGGVLSQADRDFIDAMRRARAAGVGFGFMQQVIEWQWQSVDPVGAWGPEYFEERIAELEKKLRRRRRGEDS